MFPDEPFASPRKALITKTLHKCTVREFPCLHENTSVFQFEVYENTVICKIEAVRVGIAHAPLSSEEARPIRPVHEMKCAASNESTRCAVQRRRLKRVRIPETTQGLHRQSNGRTRCAQKPGLRQNVDSSETSQEDRRCPLSLKSVCRTSKRTSVSALHGKKLRTCPQEKDSNSAGSEASLLRGSVMTRG